MLVLGFHYFALLANQAFHKREPVITLEKECCEVPHTKKKKKEKKSVFLFLLDSKVHFLKSKH